MRKLVMMVAVLALFAGTVFCGSSSSSNNGGTDAGTGVDAGTDAGTGLDAGTDAGTGVDAGTDAGTGVDAGTDAGTGGGSAATVGQLCTSLGSTIPSIYETCYKATPAFVATISTAFTSTGCDDATKAVAAGRARYDATKGQSCLSAYQSVQCATFSSDFSACDGVLTGTVPNGGQCWTSADCATGTCSDACPGTCLAYIAQGQPCGTSVPGDCGPGLQCDFTSNTCKATSAAGGQCPCKGATYCDSTNVCQNQKTSGSCTSGDECAVGYTCVSSTCKAYVGLGSTCTVPSSVGGSSECGIGSYCDPTTSKCIDYPSVANGQSCATFQYCLTGFCDSTTHVCVAPKAVGATCDPSSFGECVDTAYCDTGTSKCTAKKPDGSDCTITNPFVCQGTCDFTTSKCVPGTTPVTCHEP